MQSPTKKNLSEQQILSPSYQTETIHLTETFQEFGYVELPELFPANIFARIKQEAIGLEKHAKQRDIYMFGTPRHLSTIGGTVIKKNSPFLGSLYQNSYLRSLMQKIVQEDIRDCQHHQEWMAINFFNAPGSTHGWHLDDPPYTLNLILEKIGDGGHVEILPSWTKFCQAKNIDNPVSNWEGVTPVVYKHEITDAFY